MAWFLLARQTQGLASLDIEANYGFLQPRTEGITVRKGEEKKTALNQRFIPDLSLTYIFPGGKSYYTEQGRNHQKGKWWLLFQYDTVREKTEIDVSSCA